MHTIRGVLLSSGPCPPLVFEWTCLDKRTIARPEAVNPTVDPHGKNVFEVIQNGICCRWQCVLHLSTAVTALCPIAGGRFRTNAHEIAVGIQTLNDVLL